MDPYSYEQTYKQSSIITWTFNYSQTIQTKYITMGRTPALYLGMWLSSHLKQNLLQLHFKHGTECHSWTLWEYNQCKLGEVIQ